MKTYYDVVICGGGTAGAMAGAAAARQGADTLIIEENACLGGMATSGMISMFMGFADGETQPVKGLVGEMQKKLAERGACSESHTIYLAGRKEASVLSQTYDSEALKVVLDEIVLESGAQVLFHAKVIGLTLDNGKIISVQVSCADEIITIGAGVFIDASFHGSLGHMAGIPLQSDYAASDFQPGSLMFKMADIDTARYLGLTPAERRELAAEGIQAGQLYVDTIMSRPLGKTGVHFHNMSRVPLDPTDPESWTAAEISGRAQVSRISRYLVEKVPGYEQAKLTAAGAHLGLRDSRRFRGIYTLTKDDVMRGTYFDDAVAASSFPIDIHPKDTGFSFVKPAAGVFYVPYRSMVCHEVGNLILAGRLISADVFAHAALRVMITCMRIGESAGKAAALSLRQGVDPNAFPGEVLRGVEP